MKIKQYFRQLKDVFLDSSNLGLKLFSGFYEMTNQKDNRQEINTIVSCHKNKNITIMSLPRFGVYSECFIVLS